jgi:hypothetical protein
LNDSDYADPANAAWGAFGKLNVIGGASEHFSVSKVQMSVLLTISGLVIEGQ